jgi:serine/threonine-protein kinase
VPRSEPPEPAPEERELIGQTLDGKYLVVRLLGRGGMGAVYEARNVATHKRVAVKVLSSPELAQHPELVRRFFQEARAGAIVESEHVVQVYDSGWDAASRNPYMVMELLEGEDLESVMRRLRVLPPATAAKIVLQVATGLAKAHAAGIIHRDIKPANVYLVQRESGELVVKLLDFGVAKVRVQHFQETQAGLTRTGSLLGTPLYMSPEQAKGRSGVDARSDVWSLGVMLYELLSGRIPYTEASTLGELIISICTEEIPLLQDLAPWVPAELAEVTHRAISRDVDKRYADAAALRDALLALVADGPRLTGEMLVTLSESQRGQVAPRFEVSDSGMLRARSRDGLAVTQVAPAPGSRALRWLAIASALVVVLGLAGFAIVSGLRPRPEPAVATHSGPPLVVLMSAEREPPVTPAAPRRFRLEVAPERVSVTIDGKSAELDGRHVTLEGHPGEVRRVKLELEGRSAEHTIAITESGLLPASVSLPSAPAPRVPVQRTPKPESAPSPGPAPVKPKPKLESNWPG